MSKQNKISDKYNFNTIAYVRPTEKCNLRCKHCFIPPNPAAMSDEQILNVPMQLSNAGVSGNVLLQWHGGEPLLMDPFRCEELVIKLNSLGFGFNINFIHGIQTNLIVLKDFAKKKRNKWYQVLSVFFEQNLIGISWDNSIRGINLKPQQRFYGYFDQSIDALREGQYFKNDFSPVVTITAAKPFLKHVSALDRSLHFLKWLDFKKLNTIHIEKLTPTGDAIKNWGEIGVTNLEYSKAMVKFYLAFKRYKLANPDSRISISPFDDLEQSIKTGEQNNICASGACQTKMFTFSDKGMRKACTAIAEHDASKLKIYQDNVEANCAACKFNHICNGGCPAHNNVVDESGECSGAYKLLEVIEQQIQSQNNQKEGK